MTEQIPNTMRAVVLTGHGGLDKLEYRENWPTPQPDPEQVLIKVHACGLNNTDVNTRSGWYSKTVREATTGDAYTKVGKTDPSWGGAPIEFPRIQGADVAGTVVALGDNADANLLGKRVLIDTWLRDWDDPLNRDKCGYFGSECDGGFADYTVVDQRNVHPINSPLSDAELATFATAYATAENMLNRAQVTQDDRVLITGASGGVGSALIQLAKRRGAMTIALASESKHEQVAKLDPDALLSRSPADLKATLKEAIGKDTVSVVADNCLRYRFIGSQRIADWDFMGPDGHFTVAVKGNFTADLQIALLDRVLAGDGLAHLPTAFVKTQLDNQTVVRLLEDYTYPYPALYLYYPRQNRQTETLRTFVEFFKQSQ